MLAAGEALAQEHSYDLIHGHDWLVGQAAAGARRHGCEMPYVTTIHATEHGRHQGWVRSRRSRTSMRSSAGWPAARTR